MPVQPPPPKPPDDGGKSLTQSITEWVDYLVEVKKYIKKLKKLQ